MKKIGIIGYGEIGQSLEKCYLGKEFSIGIVDLYQKIHTLKKNIDVLNICIPYTDEFINIVVEYINDCSPNLVIIHSTVIPETTKKIISKTDVKNIIHSPVRGVHPNLYEGLKTFEKVIGGENSEAIDLAIAHYEELGLKYLVYKDSVTSELAKILCTTYYGLCIAFHNDIYQLCKTYNTPFEQVATIWNNSYNQGYQKLGMSNVVRPVLYPPKDGKIGGHCVIPNAKLCQSFFNSLGLDYILQLS